MTTDLKIDRDSIPSISRRGFLAAGVASLFALPLFSACSRRQPYVRKAAQLDLGHVKTLFYTKLYIREASVILFHDAKGWSVLGTRCSYEGCDLTYHDNELFCVCCNSYYTHQGEVISGHATVNLPYYKLKERDLHIITLVGPETVDANYRFTTPNLEIAYAEIMKTKTGTIADGVVTPNSLLVIDRPSVRGLMFRPVESEEIHKAEMIK